VKLPALWAVLPLLSLGSWSAATVCGQPYQPVIISEVGREAATVEASAQVLNEIMAVPASSIPRALLADAQAIAILPGLLKGGFVVGIRFGRGVVVIRDEQGQWQPPAFISITGGSLGWQVGIQATDVVLVFKTKKGVEGLMRGKFTIGVDAAAAAGPVGREAAAATDTSLKAEIYSYCRSRGLFVGVALDGSALEIDYAANSRYYQTGVAPPGQPMPLPASAVKFLNEVAQYTASGNVPAPVSTVPIPAASIPLSPTADAQTVQRQLADSAQRLFTLVDDDWKRYLALPAEIYSADRRPTVEAVNLSLGRFNSVVANPQYQTLSQRREFQETFSLLKRYAVMLGTSAALALPPPPK
jgi:SH3 domain-containing YSC84-like protein 1